jgi:hypothetical protein
MNRRGSSQRRKAFGLAIAVVAVLGVSAISAGGAQALSWQPHLTRVLSGAETETVAGTGSVTISSTVLGTPTTIECGATNSGSIGAGGKGSNTISLTGCTVAAPSHCVLATAPALKASTELVSVSGSVFQKFTPAVEKSFATLEYTGGSCPLSGVVAPLSGSFAGSVGSAVPSESRTVSLTKTEPWPEVALKLGKAAATLSGSLLGQHLTGPFVNNPWAPIWESGTGGGWLVEGTGHSYETLVRVTGGPMSFGTVSVLGVPVSVSCSETRVIGGNLNSASTESLEGLLFAGCKTAEPVSCIVGNRPLYPGTILFPEMTGTLMSVGGKTYERFTATKFKPTEPIMSWSFEGSLCPLTGDTVALRGSIVALGPELGTLKGVQPFEFSKASSEIIPAEERLRVGSNAVTMSGSLNQEREGIYKGLPWGAF